MKHLIKRLLLRFGYELKRRSTDAFEVQKSIVHSTTPVIFDVGAWTGEVTQIYRRLFPSASIYSFEPFSESFEQLRQNTMADNARTRIFNLAVAEEAGVATLNANESSATNSLLPSAARGNLTWGLNAFGTERQVKINTTSVDCFCREHAIPVIDILKLDIQGGEFAALTGAQGMLSRQKIGVIYLEIILAQTYEGQHKLHEYLSLLDSFGFELLDLYEPWRRGLELLQADFLFLRRGLKQTFEDVSV